MISSYEVRQENGEEVLYFHLSYQYEFAEEFSTYAERDLRILSNQFLNTNQIPFHGNQVYFLLDGKIVRKISLKKESFFYGPDQFVLSIQIDEKAYSEIFLREYLLSILFSYYSPQYGDEVFKCICILFQTYAYKMMKDFSCLPHHSLFGEYVASIEYQDTYQNYKAMVDRFNGIIDSVSCIFLGYQKEYILPFIHLSNSGKTLSNIKYPYLSSVKSLWDITSPNYLSFVDYDFSTLSRLFHVKITSQSKIQILHQGELVQFGYKNFSLLEIKNLLKLKSVDILILVYRDRVRFVTRGVGNALGLSLFGACTIEENGGKYDQILRYYFPKCMLYQNVK